MKFKKALYKNFMAGLLVVVPIGATWMILRFVARRLDAVLPLPVPGLGVVVVLVVIVLVGALGRLFAVRRAIDLGNRFLASVPLVNKIYEPLRQILHFLLAKKPHAFGQPALIEFPRRGMRSLCFVTGAASGSVREAMGEDSVHVFCPTSPNPTSGFLLVVPRRDVVLLRMGVEEALRLILSGGMVGAQAAQPRAQAAGEERSHEKPD
ncbi:MAG: DUF502 domain-containing protein [Elusimicrobiota bacterium]